jgi:hypothetical protein
MDSLAYISGSERDISFPLSRFLPPIPAGLGAAILARHAPGCQWVLDPFGIAPWLDVELAQAGCNVLVAENNPVSRFLLELASAPPKTGELQAALSELASVRKGEERLETHLLSLYETRCNKCRRMVQVEAYVWEKGAQVPSGRIYHCPCGEEGEFDVNEEDLSLYAQITSMEILHRASALERVTRQDDPDRIHAEQALACYQPRAIYALMTIINKLDAILPSLSREVKRALFALLLVAFDETNSLWSHPADRPRPKQLTIPTRFLEKNLWLSLEQAVRRWEYSAPVNLSEWQDSQPLTDHSPGSDGMGSIYVFEGRARDIVPALKIIQPGVVITALPRPNQAYWTLSALWTGWLWGREAASSFKSVLRRRRYDWNWHSQALQAAMKPIASNLPLNTPIFAILAEPEPAFLTASLVAAAEAGFDQEGIAWRGHGEPIQITWRRKAFQQEEMKPEEIDPQIVKDAVHNYLSSRGEPVPYLYIHAACLSALEAAHLLHHRDEAISYLQTQIQNSLADPEYQHFSISPNVETGLWSLAHWQPKDTLSDKVENALVNLLEKNPGISSTQLVDELNSTFPGLFTPSLELIQVILKSYAVESNGTWALRQGDTPPNRMAEMEAAVQSLENLAPRLGFTSDVEEKEQHIARWREGGIAVYSFVILSSTVTGTIFHTPGTSSGQSILVIPTDRTNLLSFKREHDPALQANAEKWKVIVYEDLDALTRQSNLNRETWEKNLTGSSPESTEQLKLF